MNEIQEVLHRVWTDLLSRPSGPESFRFIFQPIMAAVVATLDGIKDARAGRTPYFRTLLRDPAQRGPRLREGFKATSRIIALGFGLDAIYQFKTVGTFYPGEAIVIVFLLAFLPYLLVRGPADRVARWWLARKTANRI